MIIKSMSSLGRSVRRETSSSSFDAFDLMRGVQAPRPLALAHALESGTAKMRLAARSLCSLDRKSSKGSGSRSRGSLRGKRRGSMPTIRDRCTPISMQNESWDTSNTNIAPLQQRQRYTLDDRKAVLGPAAVPMEPSISSLNYSHRSTKKVHAVSFSKSQDVIIPRDLRESDHDATDTWYTTSENDTFLLNDIERAERIDRIMQYAKSTGEASYNSSTGLVSPQVLHEYISAPEEIIGIEKYLLPQKKARDSLKRHHVNVFLGLQAEDTMIDSELLADRLHESSTISTHMALERANYINKLT